MYSYPHEGCRKNGGPYVCYAFSELTVYHDLSKNTNRQYNDRPHEQHPKKPFSDLRFSFVPVIRRDHLAVHWCT